MVVDLKILKTFNDPTIILAFSKITNISENFKSNNY